MRTRIFAAFAGILACALVLISSASAQNKLGTLDFSAHITPTAAHPEPVRDFTFYVLTKSYQEIVKDTEAQFPVPSREAFIADLKVTPELKKWITDHDIMDLTAPGMDTKVTPDDIIHVPEFLLAYERSNSGGVTRGLPIPKFTDAEKKKDPARYERMRQEYLTALRKFIAENSGTMAGFELELEGVNPEHQWAQIHSERARRVARIAPDVAQTRYLAGKTDTDLNGHGAVTVPAGNYWIGTLNLDAAAGDTRLQWDVPVIIAAGRTTRVDLNNLNALDTRQPAP